MTLPPLANVFAFSSPDPDLRDEVAADLLRSGSFAEVWRPHPQWVVAEAPLPDSPPTVEEAKRAGLVFVEGRNRLVGGAHPQEAVARLLDVLAAGPSRLATLPGDFGLVQFRGDGSAFVARSCAGRVPLYVWGDDTSVAIATLQRDLVAHLPGKVEIDPLSQATWMTRWPLTVDDRTLVAGARLLPSGHCCVVARARPATFERYWDPRPERPAGASPASLATHAAQLRELLVSHLGEELDPDGRNVLSASGGVDSSSVGALAVGPAQRPISITVSLVPPSDPVLAREMTWITPLLDHLGVERRDFLYGLPAVDRLYRETPPSFVPTIHPVLCRLTQLVEEADVRTYVGGEFCDDLFGALRIHDWNEAVSPWQALRRTGKEPHGRGSVLRWARDRAFRVLNRPILDAPSRLPEPVRASLQEEYAEWYRRRRRQFGSDKRPRRYVLERTPYGLSWIEMNWEITSLLSVRRVFPFITRAMLELGAACHPHEVLADGPKTLLRTGLKGDVPSRNLERRDKGGWGRKSPRPPVAAPGTLPMEAAAILEDAWLSPPDECESRVAWPLLHLVRSLEQFHRLRSRGASGDPGCASSEGGNQND